MSPHQPRACLQKFRRAGRAATPARPLLRTARADPDSEGPDDPPIRVMIRRADSRAEPDSVSPSPNHRVTGAVWRRPVPPGTVTASLSGMVDSDCHGGSQTGGLRAVRQSVNTCEPRRLGPR